MMSDVAPCSIRCGDNVCTSQSSAVCVHGCSNSHYATALS